MSFFTKTTSVSGGQTASNTSFTKVNCLLQGNYDPQTPSSVRRTSPIASRWSTPRFPSFLRTSLTRGNPRRQVRHGGKEFQRGSEEGVPTGVVSDRGVHRDSEMVSTGPICEDWVRLCWSKREVPWTLILCPETSQCQPGP